MSGNICFLLLWEPGHWHLSFGDLQVALVFCPFWASATFCCGPKLSKDSKINSGAVVGILSVTTANFLYYLLRSCRKESPFLLLKHAFQYTELLFHWQKYFLEKKEQKNKSTMQI